MYISFPLLHNYHFHSWQIPQGFTFNSASLSVFTPVNEHKVPHFPLVRLLNINFSVRVPMSSILARCTYQLYPFIVSPLPRPCPIPATYLCGLQMHLSLRMFHLFPVWSRCLVFPSREMRDLYKPSPVRRLSALVPKPVNFSPLCHRCTWLSPSRRRCIIPSPSVFLSLLFFVPSYTFLPHLLPGCVTLSHCMRLSVLLALRGKDASLALGEEEPFLFLPVYLTWF